MLTLSGISKNYGPKVLFTDLSFQLLRGERVGLVGPNGAGKTTLFAIIQGETEAETGRVELERGTRVGFLPQESAPAGGETVLELAASVDAEMEALYRTFRETADTDAPAYLEAVERFTEHDGFRTEATAKRVLSGLAFRDSDFDQPASSLSGGWIMRAHLARLLVMAPDLLLLDEPTNHLDLETLGWFRNQLRNYPGALLTISHDREFLNDVCDGIAELNNGRLRRFQGGYDDYLRQKRELAAQQQAAYENQQKEIARLQAFVDRFRYQASKAAQAQARLKQLEKMERVEPPEPEAKTIGFRFPKPPRGGQRVATLENVAQAYGDHTVYTDLNLTIEKGERIVLVGPNGAGKSTLLKILAGIVPVQQGSRSLGHNIGVGYFSQQRADALDLGRSVLDEAMEHVAEDLREQDVRTLLGAFLFRGDDVFKPVRVLSGGEKSRLALVKLLLAPPNFLLLDEPTTHLDLASIDALVGALKEYDGTLVVVSHDVHFIRATASRTVKVGGGGVTNYAGGYDYYLRKSGAASEQAGLVAGPRNARPDAGDAPAPAKSAKTSAKERRRREAEARKAKADTRRPLETEVARIEEAITDLEARQKTLAEQLQALGAGDDAPDGGGDAADLNRQLARVAKQLEEKTYEWEIAAGKLESLG